MCEMSALLPVALIGVQGGSHGESGAERGLLGLSAPAAFLGLAHER